jgi:hypothetical protein
MGTAKNLYQPPGPTTSSFQILDSVKQDLTDDQLEELRNHISCGLSSFPELNGITITVAKQAKSESRYAKADNENNITFLPTHEMCRPVAIFHELSYLAIRQLYESGADIPYTNPKFCSIFSIARIPTHFLANESEIAYLGKPNVPHRKWPQICRRTLEYRDQKQNYIKQCKEWLEI